MREIVGKSELQRAFICMKDLQETRYSFVMAYFALINIVIIHTLSATGEKRKVVKQVKHWMFWAVAGNIHNSSQ